MEDDEAITFPDAPRGELDRAIDDLVRKARRVLDTQGRLRALVKANRAVVSHLELPAVLRTIVEAAVELVGATYGALGVIGEDGGLEQFIHVGMPEDAVERIGHLPEGHGLLGALIDDPRPIRIASIADDPRSAGFPQGHPPMTAFLGVPITVRDAVYGNLYLTDPVAGAFDVDDEQLIRSLAATAGFAIDNARLFAESGARQAWSSAAAELTSALLSGDAVEALDELIDRVMALTDARMVCVLRTDAARETVAVIAATGTRALEPDDRVPLRNPHIRSVFEGSQAARVDEVGPFAAISGWDPGPALVVPLVMGADDPTVLVAVREACSRAFSAFELERTASIAGQAGLAIELAEARADQQRMLLLEDRTRIARDLHDHVIQQLFGAGIELQSIEAAAGPGPLASRIDATVATLDEAIAQIRTVIFALSHQPTRAGELRHRLLDIVHEIGGMLPHPATVAFSGPVDTVVDPELADDIAAFVREGLTNVVRHAGAESASVEVDASPDALLVTVTDDGRGIGEPLRRSGLENIAERARINRGSFDIDATGVGTRLALRIPLGGRSGR